MIELLASTVSALEVAIQILRGYAQEIQAQEREMVFDAILHSNVSQGRTWKDEAERFHNNDTNGLMLSYYYGVPNQLLSALRSHVDDALAGETRWMLVAVEEATKASQDLVGLVPPEEFDIRRGHRLQVFPVLMMAQCLSVADLDSRLALGSGLAELLRGVESKTGFTESACDQISQIVPQVLIEQLLAGQIAWDNLVVTDNVVNWFVSLGEKPELAERFETGLALSLQFLVYYRQSMSQWKCVRYSPRYDLRKQAVTIERYLTSLRSSPSPVVRSVLPWVDALQAHVKLINDPQHLARQSTTAVIAYHRGERSVPRDLWKLCVLNNLRSAYRSRNLPDSQDRMNRLVGFLATNGVTKDSGMQILEGVDRKTRRDFYEHCDDVVRQLPETAEAPRVDAALLASLHGPTVVKVWSFANRYRVARGLEEILKATVKDDFVPQAASYVTRHIVRAISKVDPLLRYRRQELTALVRDAVAQQHS